MIAYALCYIRLNDKTIKVIDITLIVCAFIIIIYGLFNYFTSFNPYIAYISLLTDNVDMSNVFQEESRGFDFRKNIQHLYSSITIGTGFIIALVLCYLSVKSRCLLFIYWLMIIGLM